MREVLAHDMHPDFDLTEIVFENPRCVEQYAWIDAISSYFSGNSSGKTLLVGVEGD